MTFDVSNNSLVFHFCVSLSIGRGPERINGKHCIGALLSPRTLSTTSGINLKASLGT